LIIFSCWKLRREIKNRKIFLLRRRRQFLIEHDEIQRRRASARCYESGRKLQGVGRAKWMNAEQTSRGFPHFIARIDFLPARCELFQSTKCIA
jgi:hypothetical protein